MTDESKTQPAADPDAKAVLTIDTIAEDLTLANDEGGWYTYRMPEDRKAVAGQQVLLADEYDENGVVIATHTIWIEIEHDENGTHPA